MYANNTQLKDDDDKKEGGMPTGVIVLIVIFILAVSFTWYRMTPKKGRVGEEWGANF